MTPLRGASAERPGLQMQLRNHFIHLSYNTQMKDTAGRPLKQLYTAAIHEFQVLTKRQGLSRLSDFDAQKLSTEA